MHLLVLSAFRLMAGLLLPVGVVTSQCTFWCSVLSDSGLRILSLNTLRVSMHLLVLSAFRRKVFNHRNREESLNAPFGAQCFPTGRQPPGITPISVSQCTFWCSVLSDQHDRALAKPPLRTVSMHLLVLSAFRLQESYRREAADSRLNAPFGAQCFPTDGGLVVTETNGSQCTFWCSVLSDRVLNRVRTCRCGLNAPFGAQCFPTVLHFGWCGSGTASQCTFWCSVLSDP